MQWYHVMNSPTSIQQYYETDPGQKPHQAQSTVVRLVSLKVLLQNSRPGYRAVLVMFLVAFDFACRWCCVLHKGVDCYDVSTILRVLTGGPEYFGLLMTCYLLPV